MAKNVTTILQECYEQVQQSFSNTNFEASLLAELTPKEVQSIKVLSEYQEKRVGVLTVTITSLLKKTLEPSQDVRQHQESLPSGYSGRTLDTAYVTPFLRKVGFPHMAESGWLTRSLEQNHAYDLQYPGKITPIALKKAFLEILNEVEQKPNTTRNCLIYLFLELERNRRDNLSATRNRLETRTSSQATVLLIVDWLHQHFMHKYSAGTSGAARLPVIALYSVYQCLLNEVGRYKNKVLQPLESHTAADAKTGKIGDIQVDEKEENGKLRFFEAVEVKYNRPISYDVVHSAVEKIKQTSVKRYYILSTKDVKEEDRTKIAELIEEVKVRQGCEIIVNGVEATLKYYLRLLSNLDEFLDKYRANLEQDPVIKNEHKEFWHQMIDKNND